jgi:hypothetical protein
MSWVILGAGNLIGDIIDAVETREEKIYGVVYNEPLSEFISNKLNSKKILMQDLESYLKGFGVVTPSSTHHIFGFLATNKQAFLGSIASYQLSFSNLLHPRASIPTSVRMGVGNYFGPLSVVGTDAQIGNFNYFNRAVSIGHDTQIGNLNRFGPAATVCGRCKIGDRSYIGANATVIDGILIHDDVTIGAGGVATKHLDSPGTYVGIPARLMPKR